jgi:hypothetical protein
LHKGNPATIKLIQNRLHVSPYGKEKEVAELKRFG